MAMSSVFERLLSARRTIGVGVALKIGIAYRCIATRLLNEVVHRASAPWMLGIASSEWWSCSRRTTAPALGLMNHPPVRLFLYLPDEQLARCAA